MFQQGIPLLLYAMSVLGRVGEYSDYTGRLRVRFLMKSGFLSDDMIISIHGQHLTVAGLIIGEASVWHPSKVGPVRLSKGVQRI
jgi:hypothetical protein